MASAPSLHISMTFRCSFSSLSSSSSSSSSSSHNETLYSGRHGRPNLVLPRHSSSSSRSVLTCSRRRSKPNSEITSNSKKKKKTKEEQNLPQNNVGEDDDLDEDAFEALFRQLEEDLKNDDPSAIDGDEEITEEDLALLERELQEALGDDELLRAFTSTADESDMEAEKEEEDEEEEEKPVELKNWQLRRIAYALKNGRRKTSIKNLAAEVCLDRAIVLELLRDPPPNLLLMIAALPDKPASTILEPETRQVENVPLMTATDAEKPEAKVKAPVHVMHTSWSAKKRIKKVQVETLERVYRRTKRPTNAMISNIVHVTNLPRKRVVKWFEDKRTEDEVPDRRLPYQRSTPDSVFTS